MNSTSNSPEPKKDASDTKKIVVHNPKKLTLMQIGTLVLCIGALCWMSYNAFLTLAGSYVGADALPSVGIINGVMGTISATFGMLFCIIAWTATAGGVKVLWGTHRDRIAKAFGVIGLIIGSILLAPMISTPFLKTDVDTRFGDAFGSDWNTRIPSSVLPYFKARPLVAAQYYLPQPLGDCIYLKDISFYKGSVGIDNGIELFFDAYLPPTSSQPLPGANSTLIRIHGGGWTIGDKGGSNMGLMNRYFAAQGYCVFDIQYGLNNESDILSFAKGITPKNVMGNFTISDMLRHIGIFCQFLTAHQNEYHANLNSVFISGGSAGGHLTCSTALMIASGNYTSFFGSGLTIKGYIPFYPAIDSAQFIDGNVSPLEMYNPELLVNVSSPPCLIYQGLQDGLVPHELPQHLKDVYTEKGNKACMIIYLPFAGHGSDIDYYSYYNQFFLYYMERFMYLYR